MRCGGALLLLFAALPALAGRAGSGPAFSARQQTALVARVGDAAAMRCRVLRLADRVVSWVRSSDLQILTHAGAVFTADARVSCAEEPWNAAPAASADPGADPGADPDDLLAADDWDASGSTHTLRIERLRLSDAGRYECQVNTEPKLSLSFNLTVVEEELPSVWVRAITAEVSGQAGGAARLACEARYRPAPRTPGAMPPLRLRWLHDGAALDTQSSRGGVSLEGERWAARAVSRLTLAHLHGADAGRYTCAVGGRSADVLLRVTDDAHNDPLEGELESMQRDQAAARTGAATAAVPLPVPVLLLLSTLLPLPLPLPVPVLLLLATLLPHLRLPPT